MAKIRDFGQNIHCYPLSLSSGESVEKARELFLDAKVLDVDCAVTRVYHAQFEYLEIRNETQRLKAIQILSEAKTEGL